MSEATLDAEQAAALEDAARAIDRERIKQIGSYHFAMVMGALTLFGAAVTWAEVTGWALARFAAVANGLVAAYVISATVHEWGHFAGARLSGAISPVLEKPRRHFFLFDFAMDRNDRRQFLWMSWGGIVTPWLAALLAAVLVPLTSTAGAVLFAALVARAAATAKFEVPVALGVGHGAEPGAELARQLPKLAPSRTFGAVVGVACFALLWLGA